MTLRTDANAGSQRRPAAGDTSRAARVGFNPRHPSMELPPEHLVRLLNPDTRRQQLSEARQSHQRVSVPSQPAARQPRQRSPAPSGPGEPRPRPRAHAPSRRQPPQSRQRLSAPSHPKAGRRPPAPIPPSIRAERSHAEAARAAHRKRHRSLLLPAVGLGLLLGLVASGYLFLYKGVPVGTHTGSTPRSSTPTAQKQTEKVLDAGRALRTAQMPSNLTVHKHSEDQPASGAAARQAAMVAPSLAKPVPSARSPEWQAALEAERLRLRDEAEKRFAKRLATREKYLPTNRTRAEPLAER
jgi:hypothetical protein